MITSLGAGLGLVCAVGFGIGDGMDDNNLMVSVSSCCIDIILDSSTLKFEELSIILPQKRISP